MARTTLTVQTVGANGSALSTTAADVANGNQFIPAEAGGAETLIAFFSVGGCTVTMRSTAMVDEDLTVPDRVITIPPATVYLLVLDLPSVYKQVDGNIYLDFSGACTIALYEI